MGLVSIHSFLMKRMTAVAEEIFEAVKGSIIEYEQEIERLKQENASLKSNVTLNQRRSSTRAETLHDTQRPGGEDLQGPLGSELSEIRVKMEVATVMSQEPTSHASSSTSPLSEESKWQEPHRCLSRLPNVLLKNEDNGDTDPQSTITVKSELCDNQANDLHSSAVQFISDSQVELPEPEQDQPSLQLSNQTSATPQRAVQSHQNILICRFCRRIFRTKGRLQRHILVHRNDTPFNWVLSGSRFKSKINLKPNERLHTERRADDRNEDSQVSHVEIILQPDSVNEDTNQRSSTRSGLYDQGPGKYPFYCKICDRPFRRQKSMKNHMLLHQGDRNYPCKVCGRRFYKSWHLAEHLRIHTGEKPFGCNECGKRFVQWNQARSHIIKHHAGDMSLLSKS